MRSYETSATVQEQGQVRLTGVPFAVGTEVEITICPKSQIESEAPVDEEALATSRERMRELFRTTHGFRSPPRLTREELYERGSLR
jgi:hypothetical protein